MLEIRTFTGTAEELAHFVVGVWGAAYAGRMAFPLWSAPYLDWQLRLGDEKTRPLQLAAYRDGKLVGTLLATSQRFRTPAGVVEGWHGSWLSVLSDERGSGIVKQLAQERIRRTADSGGRLIVSYRYVGSRHSLAERPVRGKNSPGKVFAGKVGFWARVLDSRKAAAWNVNFLEAQLTAWSRPLTPAPHVGKGAASIRACRASDIPTCVAVMQSETAGLPLAVDWDAATLSHQLLGSPLAHTVVAEVDGQVTGLVNYHILPFLGRTTELVGIIDLIAVRGLPGRDQLRLMNTALDAMKNAGAVLAMKLRCGDAPWSLMLKSHFVPRLPDSHLVLQWIGDAVPVPVQQGTHLLWR